VEEVDATALLLPMGTAADMVGCGRDQASALAVMVDDDQAAEGTALALPPRLGRKDIEVESWKQTMPQVDSLISVDRVSRGLVMLVLGLMIAMGVLNTSLMSVIERRREFGVMLALGLSPFRLIGLVLAESAFTALLGLGGGALVSIPWAAFLHFHGIDLTRLITKGVEVNGALFKPVLRAVYDGDTVLTIVSVTLALVLGAGLYPAWKAGRVPPMEAIREN
jgi:ABC-type lipoprotein release transport system permease subunit